MVVGKLTSVLEERDASVFVPDNQIEFAVLIPIERHWCDHLEVHGQGTR